MVLKKVGYTHNKVAILTTQNASQLHLRGYPCQELSVRVRVLPDDGSEPKEVYIRRFLIQLGFGPHVEPKSTGEKVQIPQRRWWSWWPNCRSSSGGHQKPFEAAPWRTFFHNMWTYMLSNHIYIYIILYILFYIYYIIYIIYIYIIYIYNIFYIYIYIILYI